MFLQCMYLLSIFEMGEQIATYKCKLVISTPSKVFWWETFLGKTASFSTV